MREIVVAGLDVQEPELLEFLQGLQQSARSSSDSGPARGRLGMAYDVNGFQMAAEATYAQAAVLDPQDFRWPYYRAASLAQLGRYEDAIESVDLAIAIDPGHAPAWLSRGAWLLDLDRHEEAADAYGRASELASDTFTQAAATVGIARTLLRQGRGDEAVPLLENLVASFDHPYVLQLLADAYRRLGRLEDMRRITSNDDAKPLRWPDELQRPKLDYVRGFSGKMLIAKQLLAGNKPRDALEILESLRQTNPQERDLLNNLSIAYKLTGRTGESFDVLKLGLELHPDFHAFHFNIAVHYEDLGENDLAMDHLDRAIELDPGLMEAHQRKVSLLMRAQRLDAAHVAVEQLVRYGQAEAATLLSAGMVAGALEKWPLAIERFQQALSLDPSLKRGHIFLGRSLVEAGRYDEGRTALMKAEELGANPRDIASARLLADRLERGGR